VSVSLETGTFDRRPDYVVARDPRVLDEQGRKDAEVAAADFLKKYKGIGVEAAERIANGEGKPVPTTAAVLIFGSTVSKTPKPRKRRKRQ
jgi:hypothetical protein